MHSNQNDQHTKIEHYYDVLESQSKRDNADLGGIPVNVRSLINPRQLLPNLSYRVVSVVGVLFSILASQNAMAQGEGGEEASGSTFFEEIVVTAQRREESIADVPISMSGLSKNQLDSQGIVNIDGVVTRVPGITFRRADGRNGQASSISIRGIASNAGAGTTGIYIDDTPIQTRTLGYSSFNTYPHVFDLQRIEVLRGPQGTLFGAGSEGGTVRFITPEPNLYSTEAYMRSELSYIEDGDETYELGAAFGTPLIEETLGLRISAWGRNEGGWIDRVDWDRVTLQPTAVVDENANSSSVSAFKAALAYAPTANLRITPSVYYQKAESDDTPVYWTDLSNSGEWNNGNALAAESTDEFTLSVLKIEWEGDNISFISNTSYFDRENEATNDYTVFEAGIWGGNGHYQPGWTASALQFNSQENISQEFRLQGTAIDGKMNWVAGIFYWDAEQTAKQLVRNDFLPGLLPFLPPFIQAIFAGGLDQGLYTFVADPIVTTDKQLALFGQLDYSVTSNLMLTLGLRYSKTDLDASADYRGPVVGPAVSDSGSQDENPVTPKVGISYDFNEDNMMYFTAAKGFRVGGYNPRVGAPCTPQLLSLGLTGTPPLYESDSVWSYELGAKNTLADGRVRLGSSLFYTDWDDIQQSVGLNSCGFQFVANLGSAVSQGFDLQMEVAATDNLFFNFSVGYTDAEYKEDVQGGPAATSNLVSKGDKIPLNPWTAALAFEYNFSLFDNEAYLRMDYQYQRAQDDRISTQNPANGPVANPFALPKTNQLGGRIGTRLGGLDVALFGKNLTNEDTILSSGISPGGNPVITETTFTPRTIGISANYNF